MVLKDQGLVNERLTALGRVESPGAPRRISAWESSVSPPSPVRSEHSPPGRKENTLTFSDDSHARVPPEKEGAGTVVETSMLTVVAAPARAQSADRFDMTRQLSGSLASSSPPVPTQVMTVTQSP